MSTEMQTRDDRRASQMPPLSRLQPDEEELRAAIRRQAARVRRLKINLAAWALGTVLLTTLWAVNQWQANGRLESFGHEGNPGQWNPTLWALGVGVWGLVVGIMTLRVHFRPPATQAEGTRRLKFHAAAWVLGVIVLTPLWALIEWQDNGGFERFSGNSRPGDWEPWILYVAGFWALAIAIIALRVYLARPATEVEIEREAWRLRRGR